MGELKRAVVLLGDMRTRNNQVQKLLNSAERKGGKAYAQLRNTALTLHVDGETATKLAKAKSRVAVISILKADIAKRNDCIVNLCTEIDRLKAVMSSAVVYTPEHDKRVSTNFTFSPLSKWIVGITLIAAVIAWAW